MEGGSLCGPLLERLRRLGSAVAPLASEDGDTVASHGGAPCVLAPMRRQGTLVFTLRCRDGLALASLHCAGRARAARECRGKLQLAQPLGATGVNAGPWARTRSHGPQPGPSVDPGADETRRCAGPDPLSRNWRSSLKLTATSGLVIRLHQSVCRRTFLARERWSDATGLQARPHPLSACPIKGPFDARGSCVVVNSGCFVPRKPRGVAG